MTESGREIVEIFEALALVGTAWSPAQLAGCDAKRVTPVTCRCGTPPATRWRKRADRG
jgi:hypothetical protein